jgi:hypothetical protein
MAIVGDGIDGNDTEPLVIRGANSSEKLASREASSWLSDDAI